VTSPGVTHMPVKRSDVAIGVTLYGRNLKPAPAEVSATLRAALAWPEAMS